MSAAPSLSRFSPPVGSLTSPEISARWRTSVCASAAQSGAWGRNFPAENGRNGGSRLCSGAVLCSEWTGAESRVVLRKVWSSPKGRAGHSGRVLLVCNAGAVGGLLCLRRMGGAGRVSPNISSGGGPAAVLRPPPVRNTRVAYGYYLGPAYGYGGGFGSGSLVVLIVLGFIAVQAFQGLTSGRSEGGLTMTRERVSVLKLQVGLLGFARTLQNDLERISDRADTSTSRGLHYVLTETVLALLRQPDMCILGTSLSEVKRGIRAGESRFNQLSLEERGKFDEETLVNVDGNRKRVADKLRGDGFSNEYIVVTLLVAAEGDYSLPAIYDNNDLKTALKKLGSISADSVQGVEILWTPQDKGDSLTERDLLRNYPLLKSL